MCCTLIHKVTTPILSRVSWALAQISCSNGHGPFCNRVGSFWTSVWPVLDKSKIHKWWMYEWNSWMMNLRMKKFWFWADFIKTPIHTYTGIVWLPTLLICMQRLYSIVWTCHDACHTQSTMYTLALSCPGFYTAVNQCHTVHHVHINCPVAGFVQL